MEIEKVGRLCRQPCTHSPTIQQEKVWCCRCASSTLSQTHVCSGWATGSAKFIWVKLLKPQLVPALTPCSPDSFMFVSKRQPIGDRRIGFAMKKMIVLSVLSRVVAVPIILRTPTKTTLKMVLLESFHMECLKDVHHKIYCLVSNEDIDKAHARQSFRFLPDYCRFPEGEGHESKTIQHDDAPTSHQEQNH